jgi:hypothetical protein
LVLTRAGAVGAGVELAAGASVARVEELAGVELAAVVALVLLLLPQPAASKAAERVVLQMARERFM